MRLKAFQVQHFRNFLDSEIVEVDDAVTCMVGKNESGKTALLQALLRVNPAYGEKFDVQSQYPRWLLVRDRRAGTVEKARPIWAQFSIDDADRAAVEAVVGEGVLTGDEYDYWTTYDDSPGASFAIDEAQAVSNLFARLSLQATTVSELSSAKTLEDLVSALKSRRDHLASYDEQEAEEAARQNVPFVADLDSLDSEIARVLSDTSSLWHRVDGILDERMPTFFYFGNYQLLPGRIDMRKIAEETEEQPGESGLQTARALLQLAETGTGALTEDAYEQRKAELEAVSNELTNQVFEYWTQNESLSVEIDVDKATVTAAEGEKAVVRYLDVRVKDQRHGFTSNFAARSSGFRWFFSFLAAFSEFENTPGGVVVLLDEPALTLHGRAQADFLRFIEERLAPKVQVIYTTHSPFMVDVTHMERVRVVEDKGPEVGAKVSAEVLTVEPDTLFPLQAALGYDIAQSLFVGEDNLLVEGTSDFTISTLMSDLLREAGREGLDPRWRVLPAGGASNVPAFVALIGRALDVTVLVDAGTSGMQRLRNLATQGLLHETRLLTVGQVLGMEIADIEDVFDIEDYLALYNGAFGTSLTVKKLPEGARIIDRIERATGAPFKEHGKPADFMLRSRDTVLPALSTTTLDQFEKLFAAINATLK